MQQDFGVSFIFRIKSGSFCCCFIKCMYLLCGGEDPERVWVGLAWMGSLVGHLHMLSGGPLCRLSCRACYCLVVTESLGPAGSVLAPIVGFTYCRNCIQTLLLYHARCLCKTRRRRTPLQMRWRGAQVGRCEVTTPSPRLLRHHRGSLSLNPHSCPER